MTEPILVGVAWPYVNGPFHVGHIAGCYLPADIFARYQRLRGRDVLMVSGSDCHGTPITLAAEKAGVAPQAVIAEHHPSLIATLNTLGITFDLFTQTYSENHYRVTTDVFRRLHDAGYIYRETMVGSYSESLGRFLPDRFVQGTCPFCGFARARGDQCDNCGKLLDPQQLINPRATLDDAPVTFHDTEHCFLDLAKLEPLLKSWLGGVDRGYWRANTTAFTQNWLNEGLHGRAITRDLEWGVPVPIDDPIFDNKRIYVWFDAVIGYLSAPQEWATRRGTPDAWRRWWVPGASETPPRIYNFLGKDNIPFHTIIWPAMLLGHGGLELPYDVPANEFLNLEGEKMSTSRNWALWMSDLEARYQPDQLRFYLTANAPETRDANWSWADFVQRNNSELVANWGNLANRVLTIAHKHFGEVPTPGAYSESDERLVAATQTAFDTVTELLETVKLRAALTESLALSQTANQYLSEQEPWKLVKTDRERAATVLFVVLRTIDTLKMLLAPFLPFSSGELHCTFGYTDTIAAMPAIVTVDGFAGTTRQILTGEYPSGGWAPSALPAGRPLAAPTPLFRKLDESVVAEELARLRGEMV